MLRDEKMIKDYVDYILDASIFFVALYGVLISLYYYFVRDIKSKMDKSLQRSSKAVWQEMYWAYQEGDKKAKLAYIFYTMAIISFTIGFGLFLIVRFK